MILLWTKLGQTQAFKIGADFKGLFKKIFNVWRFPKEALYSFSIFTSHLTQAFLYV